MTAFHDDPQFVRWLASLTPRDELIVRLALKDDVADAASVEWETKIDALIGKLQPDDVELTEILASAERAYPELLRGTFVEAKRK